MAEKEATFLIAQTGCEASFKYDDVSGKITRVACDCDVAVKATVKSYATLWEHTFQAGQNQSENVTEDVFVTDGAYPLIAGTLALEVI